MTSSDIAFERLRLIIPLPKPVAERLSPLFTSEQFPAGSVIFREGSAYDRISILAQGRVALEMPCPPRSDIRILSLGQGELLGWSPLIGGGSMTATAVATEDVELLSASGEELRKLCDREHEIGYFLYRSLAEALARRLLATRLQMLDLFSHDPPQWDAPVASATRDESRLPS